MLTKTSCAARPLRSVGITPLPRYYEPSRHRLAVTRFPGLPGYTAYPAPPISSMGRGQFLQLLDMPLSPCCPFPTRRSELPHQSDCDSPCCLRPTLEGSASRVYFLSRPPLGSLALQPGDSLIIPKMACRSASSVSFPPLMRSKLRVPDSYPGGTVSH